MIEEGDLMMKRLVFVMALAVVPFAVACGGSSKTVKSDKPEWVDNGGAMFSGEPNVLYAVGAKSGIKNPGLLRKAAANQARAEMAATFNLYTASLMKDYSASISTGDLSNASEEQLVESAVKTFSSGYLSGVQVVKFYKDPADNTMYALARLDLDGFMDKIAKAKDLSQKVKERVRRSAERAFAEVEREEEKHNAEE